MRPPKRPKTAILLGGLALGFLQAETASAYTKLIPEQHSPTLGITLPELDGRGFPQINIERAETALHSALAGRLDGLNHVQAEAALQKLGFVCEDRQCLHGRMTWQGPMHFAEFINTVFFVRLTGAGSTVTPQDVRVTITSQGYSRYDR